MAFTADLNGQLISWAYRNIEPDTLNACVLVFNYSVKNTLYISSMSNQHDLFNMRGTVRNVNL